MADITLSDGREITIDLGKISIREWRALFDRNQPEEDEFGTIGKVVGLTVEQVGALPFPDWQRVYRAVLKKAQEPLADPN